MHINDIIHRDIKPENILVHDVAFNLFRILLKFVILGGLLIPLCSGRQVAALRFILLQKSSSRSIMIVKSTFGILEF